MQVIDCLTGYYYRQLGPVFAVLLPQKTILQMQRAEQQNRPRTETKKKIWKEIKEKIERKREKISESQVFKLKSKIQSKCYY